MTVKHGEIGVMVEGAVWFGWKSVLILVGECLNGPKSCQKLEKGLLPLFETNQIDKKSTFFKKIEYYAVQAK